MLLLSRSVLALYALLALSALPVSAADSPQTLLDSYQAAAARAPNVALGRSFFTSAHGREWSCASCHTDNPTGVGRHAATGKPIRALAPRANPQRFTDSAKVEKWFKRNCNDVLGRPCTVAEQGDVLAWLMSLSP